MNKSRGLSGDTTSDLRSGGNVSIRHKTVRERSAVAWQECHLIVWEQVEVIDSARERLVVHIKVGSRECRQISLHQNGPKTELETEETEGTLVSHTTNPTPRVRRPTPNLRRHARIERTPQQYSVSHAHTEVISWVLFYLL